MLMFIKIVLVIFFITFFASAIIAKKEKYTEICVTIMMWSFRLFMGIMILLGLGIFVWELFR